MPSMGMLGAIGGAADGFNKFLTEELKLQRQSKLEALRSKNRRAENSQSNEERHGYKMTELAETDRLGEGAEKRGHQRAIEISDLEAFQEQEKSSQDAREEGLLSVQEHKQKLEEIAAQGQAWSRRAGTVPADQRMIEFYMGLGKTKEEAIDLVNTRARMDPGEMINTIAGDMYAVKSDDPLTEDLPEYKQFVEQAREVYKALYPDSSTTPNDGPVRVQTIEEAMALEPGTKFIDPAGIPRVR